MIESSNDFLFTSESVSEGHPDKVCDQISDAILDACLHEDCESRVACETLVTTDLIVVSGEITCSAGQDYEGIARQVVRDIGYDSEDLGFCADTCHVDVHVHTQSSDIAMGVDTKNAAPEEQGAGDQGMMFGYATDETPALMPAAIYYSHKILERLAELRKGDRQAYAFLRPDSKSQISIAYEDGIPARVTTVVVSHQHSEDMRPETLEDLVREVTAEVIPADLLGSDAEYLTNPTGRFVIGGPHGDTGLTGRKIIVDTYGGASRHGGGAFSGKDPSKVDRAAAYMCRYMAKNIVAAGLARRCEIQVAYAIGVAHPVSVHVDTFDTGTVSDRYLVDLISDRDIFDLTPYGIIKCLALKQPAEQNWTYRQTAAYGHFGRDIFPWEKTDTADLLRSAAS